MKSKVFNLCLSLVFLIIFNSCTSGNEEAPILEETQELKPAFVTPTCLWPVTDETLFDLSEHAMSSSQGNFEISEFNISTIHSGNGIVLPLQIDNIQNDHFCILRDSASSLIKQCPNATGAARALRLKLGLNATHDLIKVIYQPVALYDPIVTADTIKYKVFVGTTPYYFNYTVGGFSAITSTNSCLEYSDYIQLKHKTSENPKPFLSNKDVESVIYSFQEIGQLIDDNQKDFVTVWNAIGKTASSIPNDSLYFHSILLGPEGLNDKKLGFFGPFPNKFANLAHLCPPNCGEVAFRKK